MLNRYLNRNVRGIRKRPLRDNESSPRSRANLELLEEFARCWQSLETVRKNMERNSMYAWGDQWGDYVTDPETGERITERDLILKEGKVPLKNNMIAPILKNIEGQFRSNTMKSVCSVRDQREAKIGEMMSVAVEYISDINDTIELDAECMKLLMCGGIAAQRIEYGWNDARRMNDVWIYSCNPSRIFFNTNTEDVRAWDIHIIGETFDMTRSQVVSLFAHNEADRQYIESIYPVEGNFIDSYGLTDRERRYADFYTTSRPNMCRVILGWKLETRPAYFCHDLLRGTYFWIGEEELSVIRQENARREEEAASAGVLPEDVLPIEYEFGYERYWYYRYMSPHGDILQEGRSPYWHGEHNYVLMVHQLIQGMAVPFVNDFIDQQRAINRTMMLIDFIRSASSKGLLLVDDTAFTEMSHEDIIDQYVRYNGVLFCTLKPGKRIQDVVTQLNGHGAIQGDYELLNLQLKLINDISGVNSAMQGKPAASGTAASLYAQQVQNSSLNLKGLFGAFSSFRRRRDTKVMKTAQQFYTSRRYLDLAGSDYSEEARLYDPEKVQACEIDLKVTEGSNSPSYQMVVNDFLMQLLDKQLIDVKMFLENCSMPFAARILESIKLREREAQKQQAAMAPGPDMMQQIPGADTYLRRQMNNDTLATPQDGIPMRR